MINNNMNMTYELQCSNAIYDCLVLVLNQFYEIDSNHVYYVIQNSGATHEDADDLVIKITTILSNKLLGKNIVNNIEPIDTNITYL